MCNHSSVATVSTAPKFVVNVAASMEILGAAHDCYAASCCPALHKIPVVEKVAAFDEIIGTYPVVNGAVYEIMDRCKNLISSSMTDDVREALVEMLCDADATDILNNVVAKGYFDRLRKAIASQDDVLQEDIYKRRFELIRKSSPKWSNVIASMLTFAGHNPETSRIMQKFNDRGSSNMGEYEMVITTEPHRVVGMSAFGKFTSCQDWIDKDVWHEYHHYTHRAWANLMDATVGIAYIRKVSDEQPSTEDMDTRDMLARSLIRVIVLPNGQKVAYVHRIYALSPYGGYMKATIQTWAKMLPADWHVVELYSASKLVSGKNAHGIEFFGVEKFKFEQDAVKVHGRDICSCSECDGTGTNERSCDVCDGHGIIEIEDYVDCEECAGTGYDDEGDECNECNGRGGYYESNEEDCPECEGRGEWKEDCKYCDGRGQIEEDSVEYEPYNDHESWIEMFHNDGFVFQVPKYLMRWEQTEAPRIMNVGQKVILKPEITLYSRHNGVTFTNDMQFDGVLDVITVYKASDRVELSNGHNYGYDMLEEATEENIRAHEEAKRKALEEREHGLRERLAAIARGEAVPLQVGDRVRILPGLVEGNRPNGLYVSRFMVYRSEAGSVLTITNDYTTMLSRTQPVPSLRRFRLSDGNAYDEDMFELVESEQPQQPQQEEGMAV